MDETNVVTTPQNETNESQSNETVDNQSVDTTTQTDTTTEKQTEQPKIKVKYNHEEMELPYEEAVQHIQKGMNYDKAIERARQEALESNPALSFVEKQAQKYGMEVQQYLDAVEEAEEQERLNDLVQQNIPEHLAKEVIESRKFREEYNTEKQTKAQQEAKNKEYQDFVDAYPDVDVKAIPDTVWAATNKGTTLLDAYARHENALLKKELAALKQNGQAQQASTGSVTGNNGNDENFISAATFEANRGDPDWVNKNYNKLMKSRPKW